MAIAIRGQGFAGEAESIGLMTEGTAGVAVVVLAVLGLADVSPEIFAAIVTILIGAGLIVETFTIAAEEARAAAQEPGAAASQALREIGGRSLILGIVGLTGLVLGILGLVGINAAHLLPAALIVFGGGLMLNAASAVVGSSPGSTAVEGFEAMVGMAAVVLGILALILAQSWVLPLVGFLAVGVALLLTSATFGAGVARLFAGTAATE